MSKKSKFIKRMVDVYGVNSYLENGDEDDMPWFECPECGDVVSFEDWDYGEVKEECPICGYRFWSWED